VKKVYVLVDLGIGAVSVVARKFLTSSIGHFLASGGHNPKWR